MKEAITAKPVAHRTAREKRQTAARTATWRERKAGELIEVRDLDKTISEALAMHARSLAPKEQKALLKAILSLGVDGLAFQGHDRQNARNRLVDRLGYWCGSASTSGTVRAALDRKGLREKPAVAA